MIARSHGFKVAEFGRTTINLYPRPTVYAKDDSEASLESPEAQAVYDWAETWMTRAKTQFTLCNFSATIGIHDGDYRIYTEVIITSPNGSHEEAAEWLKWKTE